MNVWGDECRGDECRTIAKLGIEHNDPSKPSFGQYCNGPLPLKTIESNGSKFKNLRKTIDCNGQTAKKHSMVSSKPLKFSMVFELINVSTNHWHPQCSMSIWSWFHLHHTVSLGSFEWLELSKMSLSEELLYKKYKPWCFKIGTRVFIKWLLLAHPMLLTCMLPGQGVQLGLQWAHSRPYEECFWLLGDGRLGGLIHLIHLCH